MASDHSIDKLITRLRTGDPNAAVEIFARFARRLIGLARSRLDVLARRKIDSEDVAQSVLQSVFTPYAAGHLDLENWDGLWSMLTVITLRKCGQSIEPFPAARPEVPQAPAPPVSPGQPNRDWEALAREPTPAEAAVLADLVEQLMQPLDERERHMLALSLQGYTPYQIGTQVGRTKRTVQRIVDKVRKRLEHLRASPMKEA